MRYIHLLGETAKELDELLGALLFIERLRRSLLCEELPGTAIAGEAIKGTPL